MNIATCCRTKRFPWPVAIPSESLLVSGERLGPRHRREHRHIVAGDLLFMETDWSAWQTPQLLDRRLCAVLLPKETAPQLGLVDWTGEMTRKTPAQLTVELFAKDALLRDLVKRLEILLFPGEQVQL